MQAHVVTRTYLKGFARVKGSPKGLVVYDRRLPFGSQVQRQIVTDVRKISVIENFYILERSSGPDDYIEQGLKLIEDQWPKIRTALKQDRPLTSSELDVLAMFAAMQEGRAERNRLLLARPLEQTLGMVEASAKHELRTADEIEEIKREFVRREVTSADVVHNPRNIALLAVPQFIRQNLEWFGRMHKMVLASTSRDFFTSDHPVIWFDPAMWGDNPCPNKLSLTAEVTFPLTRRKCLVMSYFPMPLIEKADEECVHVINTRTSRFALREVYAHPTLGKDDAHNHLVDLTGGSDSFGKALFERYAEPSGEPFDMRGLIRALGAEWEWFVHANKHVAQMAAALGMEVSPRLHS